ncbi:Coxsackievirus and adenovirus receptor [Liparis tanakae]|uniref:Coxsackievirus and adenovirus receptor n=1 Tax=Liparis tanakae TaxID=230148 RepID=A0A4Z2HXV0_9TELE|nr:Coxsackievirus and adenovirus receptor [Liparis tanakae]
MELPMKDCSATRKQKETMEPVFTVFTGVRLKVAVLFLLAMQLTTDVTEAMEVTSTGPQTTKKAQGETVNLGCTYTPGSADTGELDIEWSNVSPDMTKKDTLILSHTGGKMHHYGDYGVSKRLKFIGDPMQGDASISFADVRLSDTGTYQCKVKKAPGVDMRKVTLVVMGEEESLTGFTRLFSQPSHSSFKLSFMRNVDALHTSDSSPRAHLYSSHHELKALMRLFILSPLVPPSVPKCWVESGEEKGGPVSLRCKSYLGSTPLTYTWKRESGGVMPPTASQDPQTGELLIKNHTDGNVGGYMCEAQNEVGKTQCKYALRAYNPTNKAGVIVGAVIGALLLLLLLLLLIWLLICCCHKRRYQKEVANEIREDAEAPESRPTSRPTSRTSSLRSVMAYRTHPGVQYSSVKKKLPSVRESGPSPVYSGESNGRSTTGGRPSLKYDHRFGYPV